MAFSRALSNRALARWIPGAWLTPAPSSPSTGGTPGSTDSGKARAPEPPSHAARVALAKLRRGETPSQVALSRSGFLGLSLLVAALGGLVAASLWTQRVEPEPIAPPAPVVAPVAPAALPADSDAPRGTAPANGQGPVIVSVVGRVQRPGLVTLKPHQRVADALAAAGGALPGTNTTALNLARKLADGEQLYVGIPAPDLASANVAGVASGTPEQGGKVNLNTASLEQLDALPGVGKVTAERIVQWRSEHGRFSTVDQLRDVGGIGQSRLGRLRDLVRV